MVSLPLYLLLWTTDRELGYSALLRPDSEPTRVTPPRSAAAAAATAAARVARLGQISLAIWQPWLQQQLGLPDWAGKFVPIWQPWLQQQQQLGLPDWGGYLAQSGNPGCSGSSS